MIVDKLAHEEVAVAGDGEQTRQEVLRWALGLSPARTTVFDGRELIGPCTTCGHQPMLNHIPAPLAVGDPVRDVVQDGEALREATRTVGWLMEVADQRRPPEQVRDLPEPRVLRYLRALPVSASGARGGMRLLSMRAVQPHEGTVEVAGSVRIRGRRRALAASFELSRHGRWMCQTLRIL